MNTTISGDRIAQGIRIASEAFPGATETERLAAYFRRYPERYDEVRTTSHRYATNDAGQLVPVESAPVPKAMSQSQQSPIDVIHARARNLNREYPNRSWTSCVAQAIEEHPDLYSQVRANAQLVGAQPV